MRPTRIGVAAILGAVLAAGALLTSTGGAATEPTGIYVALGDSYTAGPLIPNPKGDPIDCGRSDHNYPTLVANAIAPSKFRDVSCGSAQTKHMTQPQESLPLGGTNPPQFDALSRKVDLVTVGIGGNDMGFGEIVTTCAELGVDSGGQGQPCTDHYTAGGRDKIAERIDGKVARRLAKVIDGIHKRSPLARLVVVGDPNPVPQPPGCYPAVPIAPGDLPYLKHVARKLHRMKQRVSAEKGAEYVELFSGSAGHDICQPPGTKWYEGIVPTAPAYPAHPNALGMEFAAREVLKVLRRAVPNRFKILRARDRANGTIALKLRAPARGTFTATAGTGSRRVAGEAFAERAGKLRLKLRPRGAEDGAARKPGPRKVRAKVTFEPIGGQPRTKRVAVRLR